MVQHAPRLTKALLRSDPERRSWLVGERGEQRAGKVLEKLASNVGGEIVYDVQLDNENIDVVAVLPTGIFVVEVKNWSGTVTLKNDVMFHGSRTPRRVHAQVVRQRTKLVELLDLKYAVEGVIVFIPNDELKLSGTRAPGTTPVVMLGELGAHLTGTRRDPRPKVLAPYEIGGLATTVRYGRPLVARAVDGLDAVYRPAEGTSKM